MSSSAEKAAVEATAGGSSKAFLIENLLSSTSSSASIGAPLTKKKNSECEAKSDFDDSQLVSISPSEADPEVKRHPENRRKFRTTFTDLQVHHLEHAFLQSKYLSLADRQRLAQLLDMSDAQVKTWFQNRRMKYKRQHAEFQQESTATAVSWRSAAFCKRVQLSPTSLRHPYPICDAFCYHPYCANRWTHVCYNSGRSGSGSSHAPPVSPFLPFHSGSPFGRY